MGRAALLALALCAPGQALVRLRLGASLWDVGLAGDASCRHASLTFDRGGERRLAALGDLSRLSGSGVDVEIEPGLVYRFSLALSRLDPVRGSTLEIRPVDGTSGPAHDLHTGDLIDALRSRATLVVSR